MAKIIPPAVTVFDKGEKPDYEANKKVIDFLIQGGVDGILVLGSTGEFTGLSRQEKEDFFRFYAEYTAGRVELYAGTGDMNLQNTVELSNAVNSMGYQAALVIPPYYYALSQEKLFLYYDALAKAVEGNLYIYNYPARSGNSIEPETVRRLAEANPNIRGLKDSVPNCNHTNLVCLAVEGYSFQTYSGFDDQFLYNLVSGGSGCIGGLANIVPELWSDLVHAANTEDFSRTIRLAHLIHRLMPIYDMDDNCSLLLKKLMVHRGMEIAPDAIFPHNQVDQETYRRAEELMDSVLEEYRTFS